MKKVLLILLFILFRSTFASAQIGGGQTNIGGGIAGTNGGSGVPTNFYYLQTTSCGTATNCTQIKGDGKYDVNGTSTSTTTVTSTTAHFLTNAKAGQTFWATTLGTTPGVGQMIYTTVVCPVTTIATVVNDTTLTLNLACTASAAANAVFIWGTNDGATLHGLDAVIGCSSVIIPTNKMILVDQSFLITPPACATGTGGLTASTGLPQPGIFGVGSSTVFVQTPDFNWASCTGAGAVSGGVCMGSGLSQIWGFLWWGTGLTSAANANCANGAGKVVMAGAPVGGAIEYVDMAGVCPGTALVGMELNTIDEELREGGVQSVGTTAGVVSALGVNMYSSDFRNDNVAAGNGLSVLSTASVNDFNSFPLMAVTNAGTFNGHGTHFFGNGAQYGISNTGTGRHYGEGEFYCENSSANGSTIAVGAYESLRNDKFACSGNNVNNNALGVFYDGGGNTATGAGAFLGIFTGNNTLLAKVANGTVGNRNTSLGSTTLIPAVATPFPNSTAHNLTISLYAEDVTPLGTSCVGNTTILWTISYTDVTGIAKTQSATETITTNGVAGADVLQTSFQIWPQVGTAVTYTATYTIGGSCSPGPSYAGQLGVN